MFHPKHLQLLSKGFLTLQSRTETFQFSPLNSLGRSQRYSLHKHTKQAATGSIFSDMLDLHGLQSETVCSLCSVPKGLSELWLTFERSLSTRQPCASSKSEVPAKNTEGPQSLTCRRQAFLLPGDNNHHVHFMDQRNVFTFTPVSYKFFHCLFFYLWKLFTLNWDKTCHFSLKLREIFFI